MALEAELSELKALIIGRDNENAILAQQKADLKSLVDTLKEKESLHQRDYLEAMDKLRSELNFFKQEAHLMQSENEQLQTALTHCKA
jgi:hypothetical protein